MTNCLGFTGVTDQGGRAQAASLSCAQEQALLIHLWQVLAGMVDMGWAPQQALDTPMARSGSHAINTESKVSS